MAPKKKFIESFDEDVKQVKKSDAKVDSRSSDDTTEYGRFYVSFFVQRNARVIPENRILVE